VSPENVILCCHDYLLQYPPSSFKSRDDLSIRTIKTILQGVSKKHGRSLLDTTDRLVGSQNLVSHFIRACLDSREKAVRQQQQEVQIPPSPANEETEKPQDVVAGSQMPQHVDPTPSPNVQENTAGATPPPSLGNVAPNVHASRPDDGKPMAQIFSKIRNHVTSNQGVVELYEYLKVQPACPEFVLQFNRCSDAFRAYIKRRLERAAQDDPSRPPGFTLPDAVHQL
jgi:cytoskeleton-associated protein 5